MLAESKAAARSKREWNIDALFAVRPTMFGCFVKKKAAKISVVLLGVQAQAHWSHGATSMVGKVNNMLLIQKISR